MSVASVDKIVIQDMKDAIAHDEEAPQDHNSLVYLGMIVLGTGVLFPYNTMLAASDYYQNTWEGRNLEFYAPLVISISSPFMQLAMVKLSNFFSYSSRINTSFFINSILVVLLPLSVIVLSNNTSFYAALILMLAIGTVNAILQSTLFAFGAMFPPAYTQAIMAGNGWSGVIVSATRMIIKAVFPSNKDGYRDGAIVYFSISGLVTLICIVTYNFMKSSHFTKHHFPEAVTVKPDALLNDSIYSDDVPASSTGAVYNANSVNNDLEAPVVQKEELVADAWVVFQKIKFMGIHVMMVFIMTFMIFPGVLVSIDPSFHLSDGWFGLILVAQFNVCDLIGRSLPQYGLLFNASNVYIGVYSRYLTYPLFILCAYWSGMSNSAFVFIINTIFSVSNGYLSSLCMMFAPSLVEDHEKATAGGYMSMFLVSGILLGSTIALGIKELFM